MHQNLRDKNKLFYSVYNRPDSAIVIHNLLVWMIHTLSNIQTVFIIIRLSADAPYNAIKNLLVHYSLFINLKEVTSGLKMR